MSPPLVVFSGLPGVGKTTLARRVADALGATFLRVDTVETAVARSGLEAGDAPVGYVVAANEITRPGRPRVVGSTPSVGFLVDPRGAGRHRTGWPEILRQFLERSFSEGRFLSEVVATIGS